MPRVVQSPVDEVLPQVKCPRHPDKVYELYCDNHDEVMCVTCKTVDHSKCGVENIQTLAKDQNPFHLKQKCLANMARLWGKLDKVKNEKESEMMREDEALSGALDEIENFKQAEIRNIERLAQQSVDQVKQRHEKIRGNIQKELQLVQDKQREVDCFQIQVSDNNTNNKCDLFIYEKLANKTQKSVDDVEGCMKFGYTDFVSVNAPPPPAAMSSPQVTAAHYELGFLQALDVVEGGCDLRDMCVLDNGQIILTDFDNKCLHRVDCLYKIYDRACKVIECCPVEGQPFGVCAVSCDKVAVTLCVQKKVCLVVVGQRMQVTKEITVGEQCRGITFRDGLLYVSCWVKPGVPGDVRVFDLNGRCCNTISIQYNFITHVCMSSDGKRLFASDLSDGKNKGKGFTILNVDTGLQEDVTDRSVLASTFSLVNGDFDEIIVGDRENKVIYRVDCYGKVIQKIENEIFVSNPPQSVLLYRKHVVMTTQKSGKLFVFLVGRAGLK